LIIFLLQTFSIYHSFLAKANFFLTTFLLWTPMSKKYFWYSSEKRNHLFY